MLTQTFLSVLTSTACLTHGPRHTCAMPVQTMSAAENHSTKERKRILSENDGKKTPGPARKVSSDTHPVSVLFDDSDFVFGVRIRIENLATKRKRMLDVPSGNGKRVKLGPGRYEVLTEASRSGFPQEARYQVVDVRTGGTVEQFPKSHVAVTNIVLERGQQLRIVVTPSVRPYNSVFYRIGDASVAHLFTRPYPRQDIDPGEFNGDEQFSSAQIAIAFWGMKRARQQPQLAETIRRDGVEAVRGGEANRIRDPELVLGVREVAQNLAKHFVSKRSEGSEDYRGAYHTTFLIRMTPQKKLPRILLRMSEEQLAAEFERQILWMMVHNAHRPNEGGGYAGKTFGQVFEEAKQLALEWPEISRQSTELYRNAAQDILEEGKREFAGDTLHAAAAEEDAADRQAQITTLERLLKAIGRERANYGAYETEWLTDVRRRLGGSMEARLRELVQMEESAQAALRDIGR